MPQAELISRVKMFNGSQESYRHFSEACQTEMDFHIYLPPQALKGYAAPVLYFLSGVTGNGTELVQQSGIQRFAAQWNIAVVFPDTSPRGKHVPDDENELLGQGAGLYVDATEQPWAKHFQMYQYITRELPDLIEARFPVTDQRSIAGFSMGGHGALQIALKNPNRYAAVSAFAPVAHPMNSDFGKLGFTAYLGSDRQKWAAYDSTELLKNATKKLPVLIDQGTADPLYPDVLQPETFVNAARGKGFNVQYKTRQGYGHDYAYIASFIDTHVEFHADALGL